MVDSCAVLQVHVRKLPWTYVKMSTSCSCYCGVGTKSNRYKWATSAALMVAGVICLISYNARAASCASPRARFVGVLPQFHMTSTHRSHGASRRSLRVLCSNRFEIPDMWVWRSNAHVFVELYGIILTGHGCVQSANANAKDMDSTLTRPRTSAKK